MKIKYLEIKNYKQFTDLTLDLTYPKGHKKEGEPLDKICIIGQSGTGKTNLLKVIRDNEINSNINLKFIHKKDSDKELIYFVDVSYNIIKNESLSFSDRVSKIKKQIEGVQKKHFIDIKNSHSWKLLKEKIENYDIEKANYAKQLANKLVHDNNYSKEDFIFDLKSWENENENILEKIADAINSIIRKFNLELKLDETTNSYEELIIKDLATNTIIEYDDISTGTKNLLSTFIPLKSYNPQDSIILIDEPEISFYPDIQKQLISLYSTVGTNNQLVVATHSPLIASSFEPWEVVELKFDKNNQIYREKYYEGENHIDNYILDPRMLTWTSILTDIFDLKEDSNFTHREKKLMEYGMLKAEIKAMDKGEQRDKKIKKIKKLSALLGLQN